MLYTEEAVRDNIRNRQGQRVFYLASGDCLTPGARDFLTRQKIRILSAAEAKPEEYRLLGGGYIREKPEHMTHLNGDSLVPKTHPRIVFRGAMDTLQAEIILCQLMVGEPLAHRLQELLELAR
jgi:ethanolamine utilization cobalamin adenosyltransferase